MGIIVQVIGSLLILIGFVFSQLGKLKTTSLNYLLLNAIGALILGIDACTFVNDVRQKKLKINT